MALFIGAVLVGAPLVGALLVGAVLVGAPLVGALLVGALLIGPWLLRAWLPALPPQRAASPRCVAPLAFGLSHSLVEIAGDSATVAAVMAVDEVGTHYRHEHDHQDHDPEHRPSLTHGCTVRQWTQKLSTSNPTPRVEPSRVPDCLAIASRNSRGSDIAWSPSPRRYSACASNEATPASK